MKGLKINYDSFTDVLYLSFGDPRPSFTEEYEEGVFIRHSMDTNELTGITILDFSVRSEELKSMTFPGDVTFTDISKLMH